MNRSKVAHLPQRLKDELDSRLQASDFSKYLDHEAWLKSEGYLISKTALHRYGQQQEICQRTWNASSTKLTADRIDCTIKTADTLKAEAEIRRHTGVLVQVIDPVTRVTLLYATGKPLEQVKLLVEGILFKHPGDRE